MSEGKIFYVETLPDNAIDLIENITLVSQAARTLKSTSLKYEEAADAQKALGDLEKKLRNQLRHVYLQPKEVQIKNALQNKGGL